MSGHSACFAGGIVVPPGFIAVGTGDVVNLDVRAAPNWPSYSSQKAEYRICPRLLAVARGPKLARN